MNDKMVIEGNKRLEGEVNISGAKNAALPILAASLLVEDKVILHNLPGLTDVYACIKILENLGVDCVFENNEILIDASNMCNYEIDDELMRMMRSSIVFLGAIIGRFKKAKLSQPGGCDLGARPIDLHLSGLEKMGVKISRENGDIFCEATGGIKGTTINLAFPSVGATENIMLASVLAEGATTIVNAAREPEIVDLANFLNKAGARIFSAGESVIYIEGVKKLRSVEHTVMPDRIEAITFMAGASATGGEVVLNRINPNHLTGVNSLFEELGNTLILEKKRVIIKGIKKCKNITLAQTMPYPGFPTDAQAILMAATIKAKGTSVFVENIFENRYKHVAEFIRMGADIKVIGKVAIVNGVSETYGARVKATDLRGGAALVVAGLASLGTTQIEDVFHIDRGYEKIEEKFSGLGAKIYRT